MLQQDFKLSSDGDIVMTSDNIAMIEGRDIYVQAFRQILSTRLGEYFLNLDEGLDFFVFLGQKEVDDDLAMEALQHAGSQIRDYVEFTNISYSFDRQKRHLSIAFTALFADGYQEQFSEEVSLGG